MSSYEFFLLLLRSGDSDPGSELEVNVPRIISPVIRKEIYCVNVKSDHIAETGQLKHRSQ